MLKVFLISAFLFFWPSASLAEIALRGAAVQGGMMTGTAQTGVKVFFDGVEIPILPSGEFMIGFGRDHAASAKLEFLTPQGEKNSQMIAVRQRQYPVQRISGLPEDKVTPPPQAWPQIRREARQKRRARLKIHAITGFAGKFIWPISGRISGIYGAQRFLNGQPRRPHYGIDIAAEKKTKVIAPAHGIVTLADENFYFEGGLVFLDHGMGLSSAFLHLEKILVRAGQEIKQGEIIGFVGTTGRSTGTHLDWRIKWRQHHLDPALVVTGAIACAPGAFVAPAAAICGETKANDPASP